MKIAVLLFGQPRFCNLSCESIIQETTFEDSTTDYYFHFWNKIAYHSDDTEYELTKKDKKKIVDAYKPKKYSFTDYSILEEACEEVFQVVQKHKKDLNSFFDKNSKSAHQEKITGSISPNEQLADTSSMSLDDILNNAPPPVKPSMASHPFQKITVDHDDLDIQRHKERLYKTIFEITEPQNLDYYLGQFVSLQEGAKLIESTGEEYDYIFRLRTDVLFVTPDLYKNKKQYINDKRLFYNRLYKNEKGIFCRPGDLQVWEGSCQSNDMSFDSEPDYGPIKRRYYNSFSCANNEISADKPHKSIDDIGESAKVLDRMPDESNKYNPATQYLHMKDWVILGSGPEMLLCMKQYINTIIYMIKKSKRFLIESGIDNNWSAGELVCGEVIGLNGLGAAELGFEYYNEMIIPNRYIKIANKFTKKFILDRPHVRVLADSDIPLKDQYKKLLRTKKNSKFSI